MNIKRNLDETNESFNRRVWFINEIKPKTPKELVEVTKLSNIWVNTILLNCIYPVSTMNIIKKILNKSSYKVENYKPINQPNKFNKFNKFNNKSNYLFSNKNNNKK